MNVAIFRKCGENEPNTEYFLESTLCGTSQNSKPVTQSSKLKKYWGGTFKKKWQVGSFLWICNGISIRQVLFHLGFYDKKAVSFFSD